MRTRLPLAITFVVGVLMLVQFFVPHQYSVAALEDFTKWLIIMGAFALVLGVGSLIKVHSGKIRTGHPDRAYSAVTLTSLIAVSVIGIFAGIGEKTATHWIYMNMLVPLEATMFSLLAFFIASAAYRTFRARNVEAALLLLFAVFVMFGRVPLGQFVYERVPDWTEWILAVPTTAAKRGILLGIALGAIATSIRIIVGVERSYLGGD